MGASQGLCGAGKRSGKDLPLPSAKATLLLHPPAACLGTSCMSLALVMLMKSNQHTPVTGLSGKHPLSQLFMCLRFFPFFFSLHLLPLLLLTAPDLKCCFPQVSSAFPAEDDAAEAGDEPVEAWAGKFYFQISLRH